MASGIDQFKEAGTRMKIAVFGMGYVGLTTAISLAGKKHSIFCVDKDKNKIEALRQNRIPFFEPGLEDCLREYNSRLSFAVDAKEAVINADVIFVAVETPFDGNQFDFSSLEAVAADIGKSLKGSNGFRVVVVKSTVLPGMTEQIVQATVLDRSGKTESEIGFCMNPEFMREGTALQDVERPDRLVLGVTSERVEEIMRKVYSDFTDADILVTNLTTAELIKYVCNSYFALTISYANEIARICEKLPSVDSEEVFRGLLLDKRISPIVDGQRVKPEWSSYLKAGCGFGGSCFPKDVRALASFEEKIGLPSGLLQRILSINENQAEHIFKLGVKSFHGSPKSIAVLGTAFKPDTDDVRESPGIKIAKLALADGLRVFVHDFCALQKTKSVLKDSVDYCENALEAIRSADIIFVVTAWEGYLKLTDHEFETHMQKNAVLVDCRSIYRSRGDKPWRKWIGVGSITKREDANQGLKLSTSHIAKSKS